MKKIILCFLLLCPLCTWAVETMDAVKEQAIERVKEYCTLMSQLAGSADNIDNVDKIIALCENNKVSTYDDFVHDANVFTCRPLFDYMQNITLTYENNVQMDYSQYQYEGMFSTPSISSAIPGDKYMKFLVTKKIKGKGINKTTRNIITVNIATMKIGGTTDESFKDPYGMYIEGVAAMREGELDKAKELLEKVSLLDFFSYRYRAKSYLGIVYPLQGELKKGFQTLLEVGENDPLAELILSIAYYSGNSIEFKNLSKAFQLLEKNATFKDKDFPEISVLCKFALGILYSGTYPNPDVTPDVDKAIELLKETSLSDNKIIAIGSNFSLAEVLHSKTNDLQSFLPYLEKYNAFDLSTYLPVQLFQEVETAKCQLYQESFPQKLQEEINVLKQSFTHYGRICALIGDFYNNKQDYTSAFTFYMKGAELQDGTSAYKVAILYSAGLGVTQSKQSCLAWLNKAAEYNSSDALWLLGFSYYRGDNYLNIEPDIHKAVPYLERAAAQGANNAALILGEIYMFGVEDIQENYEEAMKWYKVAADMLNSEACLFIGYMYGEGKGVTKDLNEAMRWYKKCVDFGDCTGQFMGDPNANAGMASCNIGNFYDELEKDYDYPKNMSEAYKWYNISIKNGCKSTYFNLGRFYENGIIVKKDLKEAFRLYSLATKPSQNACMKVGEAYEKGDVVSQSADSALHWYAEAFNPWQRNQILDDDEQRKAHADIVRLVVQQKANDLIGELLVIGDNQTDALTRINLANNVIRKYFASDNAKVQLIGSNWFTVTATETIRNYLDAVSTSKSISYFFVIPESVEKDSQGKITSLAIREFRNED